MSDREVAESILQRARERAEDPGPGSRKIALVIQGGAMRAVTSGGATAALEYLGLGNAFDRIYATSSGALNAAYFVAGQAALGLTVYYEDVNTRRFVDFTRWRKIMDLEYLFEGINSGAKRHDKEAMKAHPTPIWTNVTDADTAEISWFHSHQEDVDFYRVLKASCALPLVYPGGVSIGGRRYVDGGIRDRIPLFDVVEKDYTDVLVLLTHPVGFRENTKRSLWRRLLLVPMLRREMSPALFEAFKPRRHRYNEAVALLERGEHTNRRGHRVRLAAIGPDLDGQPTIFEKRPEKLIHAGYTGWRNTLRFFGRGDEASREHFREVLERAKEIPL